MGLVRVMAVRGEEKAVVPLRGDAVAAPLHRGFNPGNVFRKGRGPIAAVNRKGLADVENRNGIPANREPLGPLRPCDRFRIGFCFRDRSGLAGLDRSGLAGLDRSMLGFRSGLGFRNGRAAIGWLGGWLVFRFARFWHD